MTDTTKTAAQRARASKATAPAAPTPITAPAAAKPAQSPSAAGAPTKSATVIKLLLRAKGATAMELIAATDWQPHSVRAFLSGLRKKGRVLAREPRKSGEVAYRIVAVEAAATPDVGAPVDNDTLPGDDGDTTVSKAGLVGDGGVDNAAIEA